MQRNENTFQWKETQTEGDMLLGEEKSKYDGSQSADIARQKEELDAERKRIADERQQMLLDLDIAEKRRVADLKEREDEYIIIARQKRELEAERKKMADERQQMLLDLEEAEKQKKAADQAIADAALKEKEAKAGFMLQKAMSRHSLSAAQHKQEEAELAEHQAEALLLEAEEKRKMAERAEQKHREDIAAMEALKKELSDTMQEQQVEFVKNKAELSREGLASCDNIVPILLRNPSLAICIDSHTNCFLEKCKDHCIHMPLSQQRVDCVKAQLKKGGAHNNIITKGWGCKHPEIKNQRGVHIYPAPKDHPALRAGLSKMASL